jgi:hypothetical protein
MSRVSKCQRIKILRCNRESRRPAHGINRKYNHRPTQNEPLRMPERSANQKAIRLRQQASGETARGTRPGRQNTLPAITRHAEIGRFGSLRLFPYDNVEESPSREYEGDPKCGNVKDVDKLMKTADRIHEATAEVNVVSTSRTQQSTSSSSQPRAQTHESHEARFASLERSMRKLIT